MRPITDISELRQLQMALLDDIVRVCDENEIKYSLSSGTLLGAIRHKGYIPWDDDIDLYMMRSEYEKFISIYVKQCNPDYQLYTPEISKDYYYTFGKVCDKRTVMHEDSVDGFEIGVYVDIFPIDYVPEDKKACERAFRWKRRLYKIRNCKIAKTCCLQSKFAFYAYRYLPISLGMVDRLAKHFVFSRKRSTKICNMNDAYLKPKAVFDAASLEELTTVAFEGKEYKAMAGYDQYLRHTYGDYMQLPPEDKRVRHQFKAWWK